MYFPLFFLGDCLPPSNTFLPLFKQIPPPTPFWNGRGVLYSGGPSGAPGHHEPGGAEAAQSEWGEAIRKLETALDEREALAAEIKAEKAERDKLFAELRREEAERDKIAAELTRRMAAARKAEATADGNDGGAKLAETVAAESAIATNRYKLVLVTALSRSQSARLGGYRGKLSAERVKQIEAEEQRLQQEADKEFRQMRSAMRSLDLDTVRRLSDHWDELQKRLRKEAERIDADAADTGWAPTADWSGFDPDSVVFSLRDNEKTAQGGGVKYSQRYLAAETNSEMIAMVSRVANGDFKANEKVYLGTVTDSIADKINELTGIRVNGFMVAIEARQIEHILKDHGVDGTSDQSMADPVDISKMEFVLGNPDDIRRAGKTQAYTYMRNGRNRTADTVLYEKKIGAKSYYVVQAVPDTKARTLYIVTAFIGNSGYKKEAPQLINAKSPDATAKTGSVNASNVNISNDGGNVKKKFSLRQPVEETKTLIAMHNLTESKLEKAIDLGGFPMPSIAVTRADIPHTNFGEITLVMDKGTVDPKADRRNDVYSADAWTPTFPRTEYEANSETEDRVRRTLEGLERKIAPQFQGNLRRIMYDLEGLLNNYDGEENLIGHVLDNDGLKAAYLESRGKHIDEVQVEREVPARYNQAAKDKYEAIIAALGTRDPAEIGTMPLKDIRDNFGAELEKIVPGISKTSLRLSRFMKQTIDYLMDDGSGPTTETVVDQNATRRALEDALDMKGMKPGYGNCSTALRATRVSSMARSCLRPAAGDAVSSRPTFLSPWRTSSRRWLLRMAETPRMCRASTVSRRSEPERPSGSGVFRICTIWKDGSRICPSRSRRH